jgi:RNA polymerase sigma-70 factor (sigma-E family)
VGFECGGWVFGSHDTLRATPGRLKGKEVVMEEFEAFVQARWPALVRTAYVLSGDRHTAEDLAQEALARLAHHWERVVRDGNPEAYVRRALYSASIDAWRRSTRRPRVVGVPTTDPVHPLDTIGETDHRLMLADALARLTARQRAVLVLRYVEDRTERDTATVLGCSVNTVKSMHRQALAACVSWRPSSSSSTRRR